MHGLAACASPMPVLILLVFCLGPVGKIDEAGISPVAIKVTDLLSIWPRANEGPGHERMNRLTDAAPKLHARIASLRVEGRLQQTRLTEQPPPPAGLHV